MMPPNGWRVSGERGGEADERVRCTRVLGRLARLLTAIHVIKMVNLSGPADLAFSVSDFNPPYSDRAGHDPQIELRIVSRVVDIWNLISVHLASKPELPVALTLVAKDRHTIAGRHP